MSKDKYKVAQISKLQCSELLDEYHYLSTISRGFKSGENFGLMVGDDVKGVCIFTKWPVPELLVGCFGLSRDDQDGFWELSRLVIHPDDQRTEHNLASWFVSRAIRMLRSHSNVRAILSYADSDYHDGTVYAACNFKYYGMSALKKDFWIRQADGSYIKHSRGKVRGLDGEWRDRSRKHRFLITYDKKLDCMWKEEKWTR